MLDGRRTANSKRKEFSQEPIDFQQSTLKTLNCYVLRGGVDANNGAYHLEVRCFCNCDSCVGWPCSINKR